MLDLPAGRRRATGAVRPAQREGLWRAGPVWGRYRGQPWRPAARWRCAICCGDDRPSRSWPARLVSLLSVPLSVRDRVIGVFNCYTKAPLFYTRAGTLLLTLANQTALAPSTRGWRPTRRWCADAPPHQATCRQWRCSCGCNARPAGWTRGGFNSTAFTAYTPSPPCTRRCRARPRWTCATCCNALTWQPP